jgi:hypothetical protein
MMSSYLTCDVQIYVKISHIWLQYTWHNISYAHDVKRYVTLFQSPNLLPTRARRFYSQLWVTPTRALETRCNGHHYISTSVRQYRPSVQQCHRTWSPHYIRTPVNQHSGTYPSGTSVNPSNCTSVNQYIGTSVNQYIRTSVYHYISTSLQQHHMTPLHRHNNTSVYH